MPTSWDTFLIFLLLLFLLRLSEFSGSLFSYKSNHILHLKTQKIAKI
nr:MAG TPA: hypothetical protein [Caudoviricetes sp.]